MRVWMLLKTIAGHVLMYSRCELPVPDYSSINAVINLTQRRACLFLQMDMLRNHIVAQQTS